MAFVFRNQFDDESARIAVEFYNSLSEKDGRRFAAVEAQRLGRGGITYIASLLGCSTKTIERGITELGQLSNDPAKDRVRRPGAGRKKKVENEPGVEDTLVEMLQTRVAGDPDSEDVIFTNLSGTEMARKATELGTPIDAKTVNAWLDEIGIGYRKMVKNIAGGKSSDRGAQFDRIDQLINQYTEAGNPYFSIDTKAKEHLGQLYRVGRVRTTEPFRAFDHDFPSWADGTVIPHGIYDPMRNRGHINLGISRDTSEFAVESLSWYWNRIGKQCYPDANSILLLCDCGGSNSANRYLFKHYLQELVNSIGIEIRVAHYPSYCSKYNPIERRFFPHVGRACSGMLFDSIGTVIDLMRQAKTQTGLRTTVNLMRGLYETGQKATESMKAALRTTYDTFIPRWNYVTPVMN